MGLLDNEKKGWQCQTNQDGSRTCRRFNQDGNSRLATGTEVTLTQDPKTCEVMLSGDVSTILDEEDEDIAKVVDKMKSGCKKGLA